MSNLMRYKTALRKICDERRGGDRSVRELELIQIAEAALSIPEQDERFKSLVYLVEATPFEQQCCWQRNNTETMTGVVWKEDKNGFAVPVGEFGGRTVQIAFNFSRLDGHLVAFWYPNSLIVNHELIMDWFKDYCHGVPQIDAQNFHHVIHHVKSLGRKS